MLECMWKLNMPGSSLAKLQISNLKFATDIEVPDNFLKNPGKLFCREIIHNKIMSSMGRRKS